MLGPFATASRHTPMSTTETTTTTTRDSGDRYGPIEWAQWKLDMFQPALDNIYQIRQWHILQKTECIKQHSLNRDTPA